MNKRLIFRGIVSLCAAKATWTELNREFILGDKNFNNVGLITTIGRYGIKTTGAVLAYVLTDTALEWLLNIVASDGSNKKAEDSVNVAEEESFEVEEDISENEEKEAE